jgi:PAS domain S-box-containing protein
LQELLASVTWLTWIVLVLLLAGFGLAWFISARIRQLEGLIHERTDQLEDANVRISTVVDSVGEGIITIDEEGEIETFNRAASQIFGYAPGEVIGTGIQVLMPESMRAAHQQGMRRFLSGGEPHVIGKGAVELPAMRKDGSQFTIELTISAISDEGKYRFVGVLRDVTELKKSQAALREAVKEAQAANAAKSAFLANMSHELRTPMNAVLGMAHLMTTTPLSLEQRRYLTMLRTSGQSLLALLNDILDFSKIEAGKIQLNAARFELDAVLHSVSTIMSVNAGEKELERCACSKSWSTLPATPSSSRHAVKSASRSNASNAPSSAASCALSCATPASASRWNRRPTCLHLLPRPTNRSPASSGAPDWDW